MTYFAYDEADDRGPARPPGGTTGLRIAVTVLALALGLVLVWLFTVGSGYAPWAGRHSISGSELAGQVIRLSVRYGPLSDVVCEDVPVVKAGAIADCSAQAGGQAVRVRLTFQDDRGHYAWTATAE